MSQNGVMGQHGSARAHHPQYSHEVAVAMALDRDIYGDGIANTIRYEQAERDRTAEFGGHFYVCLYLCKYEIRRWQRNVVKLGVKWIENYRVSSFVSTDKCRR